MSIKKITQQITLDRNNKQYTKAGHKPLFSAHKNAIIALIGQAPGIHAQTAEQAWSDASGKKLQEWLGLTAEEFYDYKNIALIPMDFYYPGKGKTGDLPPRKNFAKKWHNKIFAEMPNLKYKILIGNYAQKYYLGDKYQKTLTATVRNHSDYLVDGFFPIPHPSPRNNIWLKKNPWFEKEVVPKLQKVIRNIKNT